MYYDGMLTFTTALCSWQADKENTIRASPIDPQGISDLRRLLKSAVKPDKPSQVTPQVALVIIKPFITIKGHADQNGPPCASTDYLAAIHSKASSSS